MMDAQMNSQMNSPMESAFGVYVHIPFCASKCDYCDFATWTDRHHLTDDYLEAVRADIARSVAAGMAPASSIFVGGGTPSMVPAASLASVIAEIPVTENVEITVECNPDDVTVELLTTYRDAGVNRISLGVQSMVADTLIALGRRHQRANVISAVHAVREVGIPHLNLDIIYGGAGERVSDWESTVTAVLALQPDHISAYALTVEAGTALANDPARHPDDDDQAEKYELVDAMLSQAGFVNYEISNWARPGNECRHNMVYWRQQDYLGFGCAAHSHVQGRRWWNLRTPQRYIDAVVAGASVVAAEETLSPEGRRLEGLQLRLRTAEGVPREAFSLADAAELCEIGLIEAKGARWCLRPAGRLLANEVAMRLR
jgi:putative oxygen-independent coproporphyrinogen III oxidase